MKNKILLLVVVLSALIASCKKGSVQADALNGVWELRSLTGVQFANIPTNYTAGNANTVEFLGGQFKKVENRTLVTGGKYSIINASANIDGNSFTKAFTYDNSDLKYYFNASGTKLVISIGSVASDGYAAVYEKL